MDAHLSLLLEALQSIKDVRFEEALDAARKHT